MGVSFACQSWHRKGKKNWFFNANAQNQNTRIHTHTQIRCPNPNHYHLKKILQPTLKFAWIYHPKVKFTEVNWFVQLREGKAAISKHYHPEKNYYQDSTVAIYKDY